MGINHQYYSDENSQNHTNPPPNFSNALLQNQSPIRWEENVTPSPGRRFGLGLGPCALVHVPQTDPPQTMPLPRPIDLNLTPHNYSSGPLESQNPDPHNGLAAKPSFFQQLGISNWTSRSTWLPSNFCGVFRESRPASPIPQHIEQVSTPANTLEGLVNAGWSLISPGPQEAGPSNWMDRAPANILNAFSGSQEGGINSQILSHDASSHKPDELRNISRFINNRFRISLPLFHTTLTVCCRLLIKNRNIIKGVMIMRRCIPQHHHWIFCTLIMSQVLYQIT